MRISDWSSDVCSSDLTELGARRVSDTAVPRPLDARHLHAEADAEEGHPALAREAHARNLALGPALTEAAGEENAVHRLEIGVQLLDRTRLVWGKSVSVRVGLVCSRTLKKKKQ